MQEPTIASRLEELNKWQEEQKKLLNERQNMQRKLLGLEQRNMYQMLGLLHPSDNEAEDKTKELTAAPTLDKSAEQKEQEEDDDERTQATLTQKTKTSGYSTDEASADDGADKKQKRKFLKRGEGLKQRFKIDPDELRLDNLPRYKYASSHPSLTSLRSKQSSDSIKSQLTARKKEANVVVAAAPTQRMPPPPQLDAQEKRFQQLLLASQNVCSSTPDTKSGFTSFESTTVSQKVRFIQINKESPLTVENNTTEQSTTTSLNTDGLNPISWAKVLDSQQIKPKVVHDMRTPTATNTNNEQTPEPSPLENLSLFELLEQRAKDGNFDANSSCIRNYMRRKLREQQFKTNADDIPVSEQLKESGIQPKVEQVFQNVKDQNTSTSSSSSSSDEDEENDNDNQDTTRQSTDCNDGEATVNTQTDDALTAGKACLRVRFTDEDSASAQILSTTSETSTLVAEDSTINSTDMFQQFKDALFSALQSRADKVQKDSESTTTLKPIAQTTSETATTPVIPNLAPLPDDLQEKTNLIKVRLTELEREIASFKENNMQLIKAKQEHEVQKAHFAQERLETVERLNDEKIQMEIYLHDERMKIEDEKRKFEQKVRTFKTTQNAVERKEINRLKQELDEFQLQMKQKEQQHVAAQARLRAKVRNLEKDQKQLLDDIELLKKENKRLEHENLRVCRENNNKMLYEINRNIAKLAPKLSPITCIDEAALRTKSATMPNSNKNNNVKKTEGVDKPEKNLKASLVSEKNFSSKAAKESKSGKLYGDGAGDNAININAIELANDDVAADESHNSGNDSSILNGHVGQNVSKSEKSNVHTNEFKREIINSDGSKDIWYPNGNLKKISADGMNIRMLYFNKDIKETNIHEGTVKYYYADSNTWHTTYLDGLEILEFPNGQTEHRYKDGTVEVHFPNNSIKVTNPTDEHKLEEWRFADGTNLIQMRNGDRILMFPNGQKEIHTKLNKRREYPDGTVKLVYPDGSQETRYSNGRVRLKDKDGKLIMDTETINQQ